jgi:uncharacterized protein YjbI with pentapeptide repeats
LALGHAVISSVDELGLVPNRVQEGDQRGASRVRRRLLHKRLDHPSAHLHLVAGIVNRPNLGAANLYFANAADADLTGANLAHAKLRNVYLARANLSGVDLTSADLRGARLMDANVEGAKLTGANLTDTIGL